MKTYQAQVYVRNGNTRIPHTVQFNAESSFAAQQMLRAQYGANNVISVPKEVLGSAGYNSAPWMKKIG
jgi:hypothetical protein